MGTPMLIKWRAVIRLLLGNRNGQSIVEVSLITPLLLIALYIPFDFGMGLFTAHLTENAVREAARRAVSDPTKSPFNNAAGDAINDTAWNNLPNMLKSPRTVTVTYYADPSPNCLQSVEVRAVGSYTFSLYKFLQLFGVTVPDSIEINRATKMWYQFQPASNSGACTATTVQSVRTS